MYNVQKDLQCILLDTYISVRDLRRDNLRQYRNYLDKDLCIFD